MAEVVGRLRHMTTSSRVWSCSTLTDGLNHVVNDAQMFEEEEAELQRQLQDSAFFSYPQSTPYDQVQSELNCLTFQAARNMVLENGT